MGGWLHVNSVSVSDPKAVTRATPFTVGIFPAPRVPPELTQLTFLFLGCDIRSAGSAAAQLTLWSADARGVGCKNYVWTTLS